MRLRQIATAMIALILCTNECYSQTDYYPNTLGTINKGEYTYKYTLDNGRISLFNVNNKYIDCKWGFKDGSKMTEEVYFGRTPTIVKDNWTKPLAYSIVNDAFSIDQKSLIKGNSLMTEINIDPITGNIDVTFSFLDNTAYRNIPIETYRKIEVALKEKIQFTMTDIGKKLNYGIVVWSQEPK